MDDLVAAARVIADVVSSTGPGSIDYCIVRPVYDYRHFDNVGTLRSGGAVRLEEGTKDRSTRRFEIGSEVRQIVESAGVPLVMVKDSFEDPPTDDFYAGLTNTDCLSYGWCGEIRHNGDVQLCSDSYGNPLYTVGNIWETDLKTIWSGDRRRKVLDEINRKQCFKTHCPHNSRGHHLNRIFHQIENFRTQGRMDEVRRWVVDLREVTLPLGHSFFI
jgi:Iron-sulfur cluster-binding domain